jgi:PAS domain S-box-containing protein
MLKQLSEQIRECLALADAARKRADATDDPDEKAQFLVMETRWLRIAYSCAFSESLADFTKATAEWRRKFDEACCESDKRVRARNEQLRWLASIVESSDDAIMTKDLRGTITSWNRGAERIFGYAAEEVIGKPGTILIPADRRDEEPRILGQIRAGEKVEHYETVRQHKDGSLIEISLSVSPVRDELGTIIGSSKIARDITQRKNIERHTAVLAREAEHRTRNILATVSATVELSQADTPEGLKAVIRGRIQALANAHALFVESRWTGAELTRLVAQELSPYQTGGERARIEGPSILLDPTAAQALAVTVHELATNAAKYGALSKPGGKLHIAWSRSSTDSITILWTELDGPPVMPPTRKGFGSRVMNALIREIGGTIAFDWREDGLRCDVTVPDGRLARGSGPLDGTPDNAAMRRQDQEAPAAGRKGRTSGALF